MIVLAMCFCSGCHVDLDDFVEQPGNQDNTKRCMTESDCTSGICLPSGRCGVRVGEGEACDARRFCDTDLECTDGFCQRRPEIECFNDSQCMSGQCLPDGRCAIVVEAGELCDSVKLCAKGLECQEGICTAIE